jgi:hypothetical protein
MRSLAATVTPVRAFLVLLVLVAACGSSAGRGSRARPAAARVAVGVALDIAPADATVEVDERTLGAASSLDRVIGLEPGLHTLVVTRDGYQPYRAEFTVTDKIEHFVVRLQPLP